MSSVHPFPARMAPELALSALQSLKSGVVLDPMSGSGTVLRTANQFGLNALGFDIDPLAVLMSKVATTRVNDDEVAAGQVRLMQAVAACNRSSVTLDWMDGDKEACKFVDFWFGEKQKYALRSISYVLSKADDFDISGDVADVLRLALSRIIVTKKQAASLAQDTSHSRPHRVTLASEYDVLEGFEKSVRAIRKRIATNPIQGVSAVNIGDARNLSIVSNDSIDAVLTSPPYLNAIDYMRGHRLSLIWLGHNYGELRTTRSISIGSERKADSGVEIEQVTLMRSKIGAVDVLPLRHQSMITRYLNDVFAMTSEVQRVLKQGKTATFVMGNSCLHGVYIDNAAAISEAATLVGLILTNQFERDLPENSRYLPTPADGKLSKRMRKEVILSFNKPTAPPP